MTMSILPKADLASVKRRSISETLDTSAWMLTALAPDWLSSIILQTSSAEDLELA